MRSNAFETAKSQIDSYFDLSPKKSFTTKALEQVLNSNRDPWKIPTSKTVDSFISFLVSRSHMKASVLYRSDSNESLHLYTWRTSDQLTIFTGLKKGAYYTHYTAMFLHGLTEQIPRTYYLNHEHSGYQLPSSGALIQENIDKAFAKEQRKAGERFSFNQSTIVLLNGQYTQRLGVIEQIAGEARYAYSDIPRTLIDISVRPAYSGGVFEVLKAFERAKSRFDTARLVEYLEELELKYPYHQVIGFYLQNAGFSEGVLRLFEKEMKFNFYLTYNMKNPKFSQRWKLFYPRGMEAS